MLTNALEDRLRIAVGRLARKLRQQSLEGLTLSQASALSTLDRHGPMRMSELAEREGVTKPSTTGIVKRLARRGLVVRSADPADGRSAIVSTTPEGIELLERRRRDKTAYLSNRIRSISDDARLILESAVPVLERMIDDS